MNRSTAYDHLYIPHLRRVHQYPGTEETATSFTPLCMPFLENTSVTLIVISMKKTSTILLNSSFDKYKYIPHQSTYTELTGGDGNP